ncbi:MAG: hypothetical protein JWQ23_1201 [Herminiimonas sp.]|nr:hypothetical protein [Herminiimonas sp.]
MDDPIEVRTEHFKVLEETAAFVSVELDPNAKFQGISLCDLNPEMMAGWHQYLKDHYTVLLVQVVGGRYAVLRKLEDGPKLFR